MPTESLILRRSYPVPVTHSEMVIAYRKCWPTDLRFYSGDLCRKTYDREHVHAAIKEVTGAMDEVFAVIDGREVRVATVEGPGGTRNGVGPGARSRDILDLLIKADEQSYWQNPHEIMHVLSERPVSFAAVERAVNVGWCAKGGAA